MSKILFGTDNSDEKLDHQRRDILKYGMGALIASVVPFISTRDAAAANSNGAWKVSFRHAHTQESFSGVYRVGDKYLPEAFERINYVMRDFRTGEVFPMDPHTLDIISTIQRRMETHEPLHILSAYRSPKTNAMLGKNTRGVASNSYHMYGQAADIRSPNHNARYLRNMAKSLEAGGVGYYGRSNFVHVDTGTVRSWNS